jgi:hypothetical protein
MRESELQCDSRKQIIDTVGRVIPVLHQYDRLPELNARLLRGR